MLQTWYENWITQWETSLCFRSTDRVVRPFEWGMEWTEKWPLSGGSKKDPERYFRELNAANLADPESFFL